MPAQPDAEHRTANRYRPTSRKRFDHLVQSDVLAVLNQPDNERCVPKPELTVRLLLRNIPASEPQVERDQCKAMQGSAQP